MGFSWNNFGILAGQSEDEKYFYIHNQNGSDRQISKAAYRSSLPNLRLKVKRLIGKPVLFRTSQNTSDWTESKWFSDIDIDEQGLQNPDHIVPFTDPKFSSGSEPEPVTVDELNKKIDQLEINLKEALNEKDVLHLQTETILKEKNSLQAQNESIKTEALQKALQQSEKIEQLKSEKSEAQDKLSEVEIELIKNKEQKNHTIDPFLQSDKTKMQEDADRVLKMNPIQTKQSVKVRGHPVRELALRIGVIMPAGKKNIQIIFLAHITLNKFRVSLPEFGGTTADAFIRLDDNKNMFVASFLNIDAGWFENFEKKIGVKDEAYKNRMDLTLEELATIHQQVMG
jgi:hypothetical protein